jgi:Mrp family chromosome partitioning ATPase
MTDWMRTSEREPTGEASPRTVRSSSKMPAVRREAPAPVVGASRSPRRADDLRIEPVPARTDRRAIIVEDTDAIDDVPPAVLEALRYLVASLHHREKESQLPTRLGFTSAIAGEGVSFISRNVAGIIAHDLRERVCYIDLNWGDRAADTTSDAPKRKRKRKGGDASAEVAPPAVVPVGLADVLRRDATLREILVETNEPHLTLVHAGAANTAEAQVFAQSHELAHIIGVLSRHFDRLILDLPPVLTSSAAIPLAHQAEAVGLVVRFGVTSEAQVKAAMERLGPVPSLGVVLNSASTRIPKSLQRRLAAW